MEGKYGEEKEWELFCTDVCVQYEVWLLCVLSLVVITWDRFYHFHFTEEVRVCIENRALIWSQDYLILHSVAFLHGGWWINWVYSWSSQRLWFGVLLSRLCEDVCRVWGLAIFSAFIPCNQKSTFKKPIFLTRPSHSILCEKWTLQPKKKKASGSVV